MSGEFVKKLYCGRNSTGHRVMGDLGCVVVGGVAGGEAAERKEPAGPQTQDLL